MVNYANAKIYRIYCNITKKCYIGSTTTTLSRRLSTHKAKYKSFLNGDHHFVSSFEILENNDYVIVLIENYECKNKEELFKRERFYIEKMECVNKRLPIRSNKEWVEDNKDKIKEYGKNYYQNNKKELLDKSKEYYENNKTKVLENIKLYTDKNKDTILEKKHAYWNKNKDIINQKRREKRKQNRLSKSSISTTTII